MADTESLSTAPARVWRLLAGAHRWAPPVGEVRFWVVQAGLLSLAGLDALIDELRADLDNVPPSIAISLLLVPVVYAALNFGVRGAVFTALWATVLAVPHWMFIPQIGTSHDWTEIAFLLVLNAMAVVVGQRVEREQRARQRAEAALRTARLATARYQSLFEDQPAPVILTDTAGEITELNCAADRLFAAAPTQRRLKELLGVTVTELLEGPPSYLTVTGMGGQEILFVPTARTLPSDEGAGLVQVVLSDVTEQHRRQEEHRMFATRLLLVQEEERRSLARELHDDPLQDLTYLTRTLDDLSQDPRLPGELAGQLRHGGALAGDAATALRELIRGLRPPVLDDFGVAAALNQLAEQVRRRSGLTIAIGITGTPIRLTPEVELAAYRIVQESLNNVIKHAHATRVTVGVHHHNDGLVINITDDGHGLVCHNGPGDSSYGLGLLGMRERVNMVGGTLEIGPRPPHGTLVRAILPIPGRPAPDGVSGSPDPAAPPHY